jgi:hypothetical protein
MEIFLIFFFQQSALQKFCPSTHLLLSKYAIKGRYFFVLEKEYAAFGMLALCCDRQKNVVEGRCTLL